MGPSTEAAGQKRKVTFDRPGQSSSARKRQKVQEARNVSVQSAAAALSSNGELNVASFIKAREFEIGALERSMQRARTALTVRAFQQVPSHMRRRSASHNAKKVPRRLRRRAEHEMRVDNTPKRTRTPSRKLRLRLETAKAVRKMNQKTQTVRRRKREAKLNAKQTDPENHVSTARVPRLKKNTLAEPPKATTKYKKRQVNKTWLPTHLWHTKRAHMTGPTEPLWRLAIPWRPTEKSYRPSHRAAGSRGCIAWDTSYMSTVACWGTEHALDSLLNSLGFRPNGLTPTLQRKWKSGTRFAEGFVCERDGENRPIAPATVLWCIQPQGKGTMAEPSKFAEEMEVDTNDQAQAPTPRIKNEGKARLEHRLLIRIHPSAFHQFWQELLKVAKMQKPQVLVEDLRFEIGSLEIQGPGSTESLLGVLRPFHRVGEAEDTMATLWTSLAGLNNPGTLPQNAILSFDMVDPRLSYPPKRITLPRDTDATQLNEILVSWPPDKELSCSKLTSHRERWTVSKSLPSQKAINRRRALAPPGHAPAPSAKDPPIPVILLASRIEDVSATKCGSLQGSWTVLLPWSCVDPVWRSLMYYPLSAGGTPRFGGLHEKQQMAFEQKVPWFPGDVPGTDAGKAWERTQSEKRFDQWMRRPPKYRTAWEKLDLGLDRSGEVGRGWACDWEYLFESKRDVAARESGPTATTTTQLPAAKTAKPLLTQRQRKAVQSRAQAEIEAGAEEATRRRNTSSPESEDETGPPALPAEVHYTQLSPSVARLLLKNPSAALFPSTPALITIRITLLDKGSPNPAARIYRLPSTRTSIAATGTEPPASKTNAEPTPQTHPQAWSSAPPAAQQPPATSTTESSLSSTSALGLRERWLALDPSYDQDCPPNGNARTRLKKQKTNRFGVPSQQHAYPRESLAKINVLPKNAPPEIVAKFGPDSAFGRGDGEIPKERPPPARNQKAQRTAKGKGRDKAGLGKPPGDANPDASKGNPYLDPADTDAPNLAAELAGLMVPGPMGPQTEWTRHPPCPDVDDLIGFVTSGGYNLSEGRGTAVGAIWAQRLVEGWTADGKGAEGDARSRTLAPDKAKQQNQRQRRLCIVRNAGESIGRLGIWECCG
ncbi:hypothetical protein A1O3_07431 [Capronia epimyces CBS 606.96]|uniref:Uncharacterized protein n=1 Tax=Capronia epimyces CBS 606.96 TaxID=1182542 RepID=W9XKT5_9EURO|nr:uncharacterized protein A1O3_07431 [Capronia epimyces CBS 606.96]EXJ81142.1 hypothetical protein A1O3_07431 [Capronia epimyces CBS 606.96]